MWSFGKTRQTVSLPYLRAEIFILSGCRKMVKTGREVVGRKSACVRRRSKSPAHDKALYPSIASRDAIIRRKLCAFEVDSNCDSVSISHLLWSWPLQAV